MHSPLRDELLVLLVTLLLHGTTVARAQFLYSCLGGGPAAIGGVGLRTGSSSSSSSNAASNPLASQVQQHQGHTALTPHRYYYINSSSSSSSSGVSHAVNVRPASICPGDPPFRQARDSRTTCRLIINSMDGETLYCTAWFISYNHVATAGHCIMGWGPDGPYYNLNPNAPGGPGFVCCKFNSRGRCLQRSQWKLDRWVTTAGFFLNKPSRSNDGAVIKVLPQNPNSFVRMIPQGIMAFTDQVPNGTVFLDGFPMQTSVDEGCGSVDETKRYFTSANVTPIPLGPDEGVTQHLPGMAVKYRLSGCAGQSGGRVLWGGPEGYAFGLQTFGWQDCKLGRGRTGVTLITQEQQDCGVCLSCLMTAIP